jgi:hypothetical protein
MKQATHEAAPECPTPSERNIIVGGVGLGTEPLKSLGLILSTQISSSLNSGKILPRSPAPQAAKA